MCTLMTYFCHAIHRQWLVEKGSGGDSRWSRSTAVLLAKSLAGEDAVARENLICSLEARTHGAAFCQVCVSISSLNVLRHTHTQTCTLYTCTHLHVYILLIDFNCASSSALELWEGLGLGGRPWLFFSLYFAAFSNRQNARLEWDKGCFFFPTALMKSTP